MAKKSAPQAEAAAPEPQVVATVREWSPNHADSLALIQGAIDDWGGSRDAAAAPGKPARPALPYDELVAKVDRLTKHVKARTVTVTETVTEYVDEGAAPAAPHAGEPWDAEPAVVRKAPKPKAGGRSAGKRSKAKAASRKKR